MTEILIRKEPKSDFEKLLFAQSYIKVLKKEIDLLNDVISKHSIEKGIIQSERDEAKYELESYFKDIKSDDWKKKFEQQKQNTRKLELRIRDLRNQNKDLVYENLKLNMKQNAKSEVE